MRTLDITPNVHPVSDFLAWQRDGSLNLAPPFQRRSVWKSGAASYLIDTVVRGLPVPLIFVRERLDLETQRTVRDVVDGQQRLRTLLSFIDETCLGDFDEERERFTVLKAHNPDLATKPFKKLDPKYQRRILGYKLPVSTLPTEVEDREVLQIFARINSTGVSLNHQELRNAAYFGVFKTSMYTLAYEQLERWQDWNIFSGDELARMKEVELTSDLVLAMLEGLSGRSKAKLDRLYKDNDKRFVGQTEIQRRFRLVMNEIDEQVGDILDGSVFDREMHFYSLYLYVYDRMWGLGSDLKRTKASSLRSDFRKRFRKLDARFGADDVPVEVLDSVARAATDTGRRSTRYEFTKAVFDAKAS